jgi:uncharacterized protein (TIGR02594 family)
MTIVDLQKALRAAGFDPGPLDGISGPKTRAAIRSFQARMGLVVDGIAGPKTQSRLFASPAAALPSPAAALPWLAEARRLIGTREIPGPRDNPVILDWARATRIPYDDDETPWCGLFMAHCIAATLPDEPLPANPLGARNWLKFGRDMAPQMGAILVFSRGSVQSWSGHVALYAGEEAEMFHILGGNQSDTVSIAKIAKSRLLGARWPHTVAPLNTSLSTSGSGLPLSTNEA